jgi:lipopolysaccharide biosynthesis glycosyltransferase
MSILRNDSNLCTFADQDALNLFFHGHFHALPLAYNVTRHFYDKILDYNDPVDEVIAEEAAKAPIILHYTGSSKPWHLHNKHPLKQKYRNLRGRFHWYPYALGISTAESLLELLQNAQKAVTHSFQNSKAAVATSLKKFVLLYQPSGSLGRLRLRPSFEYRLPKGSISSLREISATGIYRLMNDDEVVFIGCGNISDGVDRATNKGWSFSDVEYSILIGDKLQHEWLAFWLYLHKRTHANQKPFYNLSQLDTDLLN